MKQEHEDTVEHLLLTVPQVSKALNLSRTKIWQLIYYENLPVVRFGRAVRVDPQELCDWLSLRQKESRTA